MESIPTQSKEQCFETAIVDAINIFTRTVLKQHGFISLEKWVEYGTLSPTFDAVLAAKYRIARELARAWAKMPMTD